MDAKPPTLALPLETFAFSYDTLDSTGTMVERHQAQAQRFIETIQAGLSLEMIALPGGTFQMGSPHGQGFEDETPRHLVSLAPCLMARALETQKVAAAMDAWARGLTANATSYTRWTPPASGTAIGLTEAPRGALGHWVKVTRSKIDTYQILTPTAWNASPMDDSSIHGAMEQALIGTVIAARTPGETVEVPAGTSVELAIDRSVRIPVHERR
jgi:hypothetical protein